MEKTKKGKKEEVVKKVYLGRPGNTLQMGIVGLPNVGKSTTFNLLSNNNAPAGNKPFLTIDPNIAKVDVPDPRFDVLVKLYKPVSEVRAGLNIVDIAGLVSGASEGAGMGNAFLSHIQSVDGIYHVVRAFDDEEIIHFEGELDPVRDLEIIHDELRKKDLVFVEKGIEALEKVLKRKPDKQLQFDLDTLIKVRDYLIKGINVVNVEWDMNEIPILNQQNFLTAKPGVYLVNLSENDFIRKKNKWLKPIVEWINKNGGGIMIPYSADFEQKVKGMTPEEKEKYFTETGAKSALDKIITVGYEQLGLIHFFTSGKDEVRCWTIRKGTLAPQAAGVIHTDMERGFISSETFLYDDLIELGSEAEVKKAGKYRTVGKTHEMQDGEIIYVKFNVSDPKKKK